jgi:hypothetical protein
MPLLPRGIIFLVSNIVIVLIANVFLQSMENKREKSVPSFEGYAERAKARTSMEVK